MAQSQRVFEVDAGALGHLAAAIADEDFSIQDGHLPRRTVLALEYAAIEALGADAARTLQEILSAVSADAVGFARVKFSGFERLQDLDLVRSLTSVCSLLGEPLRVFNRWPLWKPLGVSFEVEPHRATGVGFNPLHVDVVNAAAPPDFVAFFCDRVDPAGGGYSVVSNLLRAAGEISAEARATLAKWDFAEGQFYELSGVGSELRPFPIIDDETSPPRIRFTAKMADLLDTSAQRKAFDELYSALREREEIFLLREGEMLILNQWVVAHGRLPLGEGQRSIPPERRRLIRQCFMSTGSAQPRLDSERWRCGGKALLR